MDFVVTVTQFAYRHLTVIRANRLLILGYLNAKISVKELSNMSTNYYEEYQMIDWRISQTIANMVKGCEWE